ncbi:Transcription-associated protein [Dirofilaria immitis]
MKSAFFTSPLLYCILGTMILLAMSQRNDSEYETTSNASSSVETHLHNGYHEYDHEDNGFDEDYREHNYEDNDFDEVDL